MGLNLDVVMSPFASDANMGRLFSSEVEPGGVRADRRPAGSAPATYIRAPRPLRQFERNW